MSLSSDLKDTISDLIKVLTILRKTTPHHYLSGSQREEILKHLDSAMSRLARLREGIGR